MFRIAFARVIVSVRIEVSVLRGRPAFEVRSLYGMGWRMQQVASHFVKFQAPVKFDNLARKLLTRQAQGVES